MIQAEIDWHKPTTVTEVWSFLGFVSYYRGLYQTFLKFIRPLNLWLQNLEGTLNQKKGFQEHWGIEQQETFETLKKLCTKAPMSAYVNVKSLLFSTPMPVGRVLVCFISKPVRKKVIPSRTWEKVNKVSNLFIVKVGYPLILYVVQLVVYNIKCIYFI